MLKLGEVPEPSIKPDEILIRVRAAGVNRADILQRQGFYPPPPGASEIIGMECAGEVVAVGANRVTGWKVGDRAMALIPGGGYAEKAAAHYGSAMKIPAALSFEEAAGVPEVFLTVFLNFFMLAGIKRGETALIHGGGSGIGTASIPLLKEAGVRVIVTAGSDEKCDQCRKLGADVAINYKRGPFAPEVKTRDRRARRRRDSRQHRRRVPRGKYRVARAGRTAGADRPDERDARRARSGRSPAASSENLRLDFAQRAPLPRRRRSSRRSSSNSAPRSKLADCARQSTK